MQRRMWLYALVTAGMLLPGLPALAQNDATIVMTSGERKPAQNIGFVDRRDLIVRTSFQAEPRIPISDVAYIDFGGTPDVPVGLSGSQEAVVLRDGTILKGQVQRIGHVDNDNHETPYLVSFRTSAGENRDFRGPQLARIYFHEPPGASQTASSVGTTGIQDTRAMTVDAKQQWVTTMITVRNGDRLHFSATGEITVSENRAADIAGPDGHREARVDRGAPLSTAPVGALIGRVGNSRPFAIGSDADVTMPASGMLFLGVNDGYLTDNEGAFRVEITRAR
ncbi:MAG: hypothetical protein AB7Q29_18130 [Vicinamibacterales bacterium]